MNLHGYATSLIEAANFKVNLDILENSWRISMSFHFFLYEAIFCSIMDGHTIIAVSHDCDQDCSMPQ